MKYILKTEVNSKGNKVFSKERNGKGFLYLAKNEAGVVSKVDKKWILNNQIDILNLGVSEDNAIYPATDLRKRKKLPYGMVRCGACGEVVWENNSYTFHKNGTTYDDIIICDNCNRYGHDGYVTCRGCTINPCWVKSNKLYEVAGSGYNDDENENLVCDEFIGNYNYCENCDVYYSDNYDRCPNCGK